MNTPYGMFTIDELCRRLFRKINFFHNAVRARTYHPSYESKASLKMRCNEIRAIFNFIHALNDYKELPSGLREEVEKCETIIEAMYEKDRQNRRR